jgi:glycosyltransferase involved in cell wall biosynthesis
MSSVREGMPNTLLEAMATSNICIANSINGITDDIIKDGFNGFIYNNNNRNLFDISSIIETINKNKEYFEYISNNARNTIINKFNIEIISKKYLTIYNDLLK